MEPACTSASSSLCCFTSQLAPKVCSLSVDCSSLVRVGHPVQRPDSEQCFPWKERRLDINNYHREPALQGLAEAPHQLQHRKSTNTTPSQMVLSSMHVKLNATLSRDAVSFSRLLARSSNFHPPLSTWPDHAPIASHSGNGASHSSISASPRRQSNRSTLAINRAPSRLT
ncbi:hypothetical protein LY76DRAFT_78429 [Colletotrichum caudatum]|nr:hypothetical protein LY76DRAFT_78429 [Colletotrichum caudatum]